jgi:hypothetical protein
MISFASDGKSVDLGGSVQVGESGYRMAAATRSGVKAATELAVGLVVYRE